MRATLLALLVVGCLGLASAVMPTSMTYANGVSSWTSSITVPGEDYETGWAVSYKSGLPSGMTISSFSVKASASGATINTVDVKTTAGSVYVDCTTAGAPTTATDMYIEYYMGDETSEEVQADDYMIQGTIEVPKWIMPGSWYANLHVTVVDMTAMKVTLYDYTIPNSVVTVSSNYDGTPPVCVPSLSTYTPKRGDTVTYTHGCTDAVSQYLSSSFQYRLKSWPLKKESGSLAIVFPVWGTWTYGFQVSYDMAYNDARVNMDDVEVANIDDATEAVPPTCTAATIASTTVGSGDLAVTTYTATATCDGASVEGGIILWIVSGEDVIEINFYSSAVSGVYTQDFTDEIWSWSSSDMKYTILGLWAADDDNNFALYGNKDNIPESAISDGAAFGLVPSVGLAAALVAALWAMF